MEGKQYVAQTPTVYGSSRYLLRESDYETMLHPYLKLLIDVVPVNPATVNEWTHGPYSGEFDGIYHNLLKILPCAITIYVI